MSSSQTNADSELVSPVSAISSAFSSASPTPSSASPSSVMFALSVSPASSANMMGIFSPLSSSASSFPSFMSTLPPLKLIPLIPIPTSSSSSSLSSSSKPPLAPHRRLVHPPSWSSQSGSILSIRPNATVLAPSILRSMKAKFLRGESTAPPSHQFVPPQLEADSVSRKRVIVGGPSSSKRQRLSHKSSYVAPLLKTIEDDDVELAALAIARELVEFAADFNIVDDEGIPHTTILEEEKQLAEELSTATTTTISLPPSLQLLPVNLPCSFSTLSSSCIDEASVLAAVAAASSVVDDEDEEPVLKLNRVNSDDVSVSTQDSSPPTPSSVSSSSSSTVLSSSSLTNELELLPPTLPLEEHLKFDGGAVATVPTLHSRTCSDSLFCVSTVLPLSSPIVVPKHFTNPSSSLVELNDFFQFESL